MSEVTQEELIALLLKVEGGRPDSLGIRTQWYRNPEGPQAATALAAKEAENAELRAEVERLRADLERNAEAFTSCEGCGAPLFDSDEYIMGWRTGPCLDVGLR